MAHTPQHQQPGQPGQAAMQQQLNPEQLKQMNLIVKQCMQMLLQDQTAEMIVAKAEQGQPAQVLAEIVGPLLSKIAETAKSAGADVGMVTLLVAGVQVLGLLAEMLFQADVIATEQEAAQVVAQASKLAVDQHNARAKQMQAGPGMAPPAGAPAPQPAGGMMMQGGV